MGREPVVERLGRGHPDEVWDALSCVSIGGAREATKKTGASKASSRTVVAELARTSEDELQPTKRAAHE